MENKKRRKINRVDYKSQKEKDFEQVYKDYKTDVYRIALHFVREPVLAEELAQVVFYHVYLQFDYIKLRYIRSYLYCATRNITYNWLRDREHHNHMECLDIIESELLPDYSAEDYYLEKYEWKTANKLSTDILEALREKNILWYEAIVMAYVLDVPQDELAERLKIKKDVLQSRLYRAKQWVRKHYQEQYDEIYKPT